MNERKIFKLILLFAVIMFTAKPFIGFKHINRAHPPKRLNMFLLQKVFRKNKEEYSDGNATKMIAIQKKMADPDIQSTLLFLSLLIILFPFLFKSIKDIFHRDLVLANLKLISSQPSYLLNRQFNI